MDTKVRDTLGIISTLNREEAEAVEKAVRARIKLLREQDAINIKVGVTAGDVFRLKDISPKYLTEVRVVATGEPCGGKRVSVRIHEDDARWLPSGRFTGAIKVPASCLVPVN